MIEETTPGPPPGIEAETVSERTEEKLTDYQIAKKLVQLKQSADSRGIPFELSFRTVKRLLNAEKCYYTGKPFGTGVNARSIDRVDSTKGYIEGNVVTCTIDINQKKANLTLEEIFCFARKIQAHQKRNKK